MPPETVTQHMVISYLRFVHNVWRRRSYRNVCRKVISPGFSRGTGSISLSATSGLLRWTLPLVFCSLLFCRNNSKPWMQNFICKYEEVLTLCIQRSNMKSKDQLRHSHTNYTTMPDDKRHMSENNLPEY